MKKKVGTVIMFVAAGAIGAAVIVGVVNLFTGVSNAANSHACLIGAGVGAVVGLGAWLFAGPKE